ncbi:MAG: polysaccharide deacetylase family protein [Candidatus Omnitrophota bacterium]
MKDSVLRNSCRKLCYAAKRGAPHFKNSFFDRQPKLLILTYHRALPEVKFNPLNTIIPLKTFKRQIDELAKKFPIISLGEAVNQRESGPIKDKIQVVLTFDDGYRDNYEIVFPILRKKGLPAVFFVPTDYVGSNMPVWDWEIVVRLLTDERGTKNLIESKRFLLGDNTGGSRHLAAFRILEAMKSFDAASIDKIVSFLRQGSEARLSTYDFKNEGCMDWPEIKKMSEAGMEIGSHGLTHRPLARIPIEAAIDEIVNSKAAIEKKTDKPCVHFSFPFGSRKDYNQVLIDKVRQAGFRSCLINIHGYNYMTPEPFCLKRIIMEESTNLNRLLG